MTSNSFETLSEVASKLIERKTKTQLIYAFNGSGKTRLSLEIKELLARKSSGDENSERTAFEAFPKIPTFENTVSYSGKI